MSSTHATFFASHSIPKSGLAHRQGLFQKLPRGLTKLAGALALALGIPLHAQPLAPVPEAGITSIGTVISTTGTVTRRDAQGRSQLLSAESALQAGDVVQTQAASSAVLRYRDGSRIQLSANSSFTVSELLLSPDKPQNERFAAKLLKGAMRVITGAIAQRSPANARFSTSTATIGIRGTDFVVRECADDCLVSDSPTVASLDAQIVGRVGGSRGGLSAVDENNIWRVLNVSSALREGDVVITGDTGIGILVLTDGTRIALDPGSRLWIREYSFDEAYPERGLISLVLLLGKVQIESGQLAKRDPRRFLFVAGDRVVQFHGARIGAVVQADMDIADQRGLVASPDFKPSTYTQIDVMQGRVQIHALELGALDVSEGQSAQGFSGVRAGTPGGMIKSSARSAFIAPSPNIIQSVDQSFFGISAQSHARARPGTYVHVNEGIVGLLQDGEEIVLSQGETAFAPADGGAPMRVRNGVRVAGLGITNTTTLSQHTICQPPGAGLSLSNSLSVSDMRFSGLLTSRISQDEANLLSGGAVSQGFDKGSVAGFSNSGMGTLVNQVRGDDLKGAGRLRGSKVRLGGRHADTFQGSKINSADGQNINIGGRLGRIGNINHSGTVSSGAGDSAGLLADMLKAEGGTPTGNASQDAAELAYAQSVGTDGYAATKHMTASERQSYWAAERERQKVGGSPKASSDTSRQGSSVRPREDDCPSCGGNGLPVYIRAGQFGIEIRGIQRSINAIKGAVGGAGDGRGETSTGSRAGSVEGRAVSMTRAEQLGAIRPIQAAGGINWDAALRLNPLVNPGAE